MRRVLFLGATVLLLAAAPPALALSDSRDPAEAAPVERLGPPTAPGARIRPQGALLHIEPSRRSARLTARFLITAPPGPLAIELPSTLFQVELATDHVLPAEISRLPPAPLPAAAEEVRIDPGSGRIYARTPRTAPPVAHYLHRAVITVPPSGQLVLRATATLSSGFDRTRRRRRFFEVDHVLHRRPDFFVYHFAVVGPGGPVEVVRPPRTTARARYIDGVLRAAAAMERVFPLGATIALGLALRGGAEGQEGVREKALVRGALDLLLPYGHALSLSADLDSRITGDHQVALALAYQIYGPWLQFLPIGGHLDLGAALDLLPAVRPGLRLGLGLKLWRLGLFLSADLFPERRRLPGEAGPDRWGLPYRIGFLAGFSL